MITARPASRTPARSPRSTPRTPRLAPAASRGSRRRTRRRSSTRTSRGPRTGGTSRTSGCSSTSRAASAAPERRRRPVRRRTGAPTPGAPTPGADTRRADALAPTPTPGCTTPTPGRAGATPGKAPGRAPGCCGPRGGVRPRGPLDASARKRASGAPQPAAPAALPGRWDSAAAAAARMALVEAWAVSVGAAGQEAARTSERKRPRLFPGARLSFFVEEAEVAARAEVGRLRQAPPRPGPRVQTAVPAGVVPAAVAAGAVARARVVGGVVPRLSFVRAEEVLRPRAREAASRRPSRRAAADAALGIERRV